MSIVKDLLLISMFLVLVFQYILLCRKLTKQREYFINTLSHDLRVSTIAQIRGLELLEKQEDRNLACEIKNSCKFTLDMINSLLNTYKYSNGEQVLNYETFILNESILSSCNTLLPSIKEKSLEINYGINSQVYINADKTEIQKVLQMLLSTAISNARNNTSMNIITQKNTKKIKVSIVYQGKPLSEEERKRMFAKNPRFSTVGHGIKMHLCKKIIDFHKGKLLFKHLGNEYNSLTFSIPIAIQTNKHKQCSFQYYLYNLHNFLNQH